MRITLITYTGNKLLHQQLNCNFFSTCELQFISFDNSYYMYYIPVITIVCSLSLLLSLYTYRWVCSTSLFNFWIFFQTRLIVFKSDDALIIFVEHEEIIYRPCKFTWIYYDIVTNFPIFSLIILFSRFIIDNIFNFYTVLLPHLKNISRRRYFLNLYF